MLKNLNLEREAKASKKKRKADFSSEKFDRGGPVPTTKRKKKHEKKNLDVLHIKSEKKGKVLEVLSPRSRFMSDQETEFPKRAHDSTELAIKKKENLKNSFERTSDTGNDDGDTRLVQGCFPSVDKKKKRKKFRLMSASDEVSVIDVTQDKNSFVSDQTGKPRKRKKKSRENEMCKNNDELNDTSRDSHEDEHSTRDIKKRNRRKEFVRMKLTAERLAKGMVMLSPKAEAKIYKLKKSLKKKGLPEQEIRQIIRQKRRSEELNFRGSWNSRNDENVCFGCRKPGHRLADCKLVLHDTDQGTGVCFRCGSTEHILRDCPTKRKKGDLPFAKCFVCGGQGHLSRECPSNPKGAFPKGGKCLLCGSINHLKRDCPQLTRNDEKDFTVTVSRSGISADALDDDD